MARDSSAASERAWSAFNYLHSKSRNKFRSSVVDSLVFVYTNMDRYQNRKNDLDYITVPSAFDEPNDDFLEGEAFQQRVLASGNSRHHDSAVKIIPMKTQTDVLQHAVTVRKLRIQ